MADSTDNTAPALVDLAARLIAVENRLASMIPVLENIARQLGSDLPAGDPGTEQGS